MGDPKRDERPSSEILTIEELALYLKVAKSTLYKLAQEGRLPAQKVGRHWRFQKVAIDRWMARGAEYERGQTHAR